jgi:hypothetical protein
VVTQEGSPSLAGRRPSFDHVLGDARLRDLKPELEQFAVDAWRAPKRIFDAHPADQYAQLRVDLRSPSQWARLPTPVTAKAGPVPTKEGLGPDDCEDLQDRRNPAVELDKEPAIIVRKLDATMQPTPQDHQLMSKHRVLSFKPKLRLEWRGQHGQSETEQPDHSANLGDSITASTRIRFSVHSAGKELFLDTDDLRAGLAADLNFAGPSVDTHNACLRRDNMPPKKDRQRDRDDDRGNDDAKGSTVAHSSNMHHWCIGSSCVMVRNIKMEGGCGEW